MKTVNQLAVELDETYGIQVYEAYDGQWFLSVPERWEHLRDDDNLINEYFSTFEDAVLHAAEVLDLN